MKPICDAVRALPSSRWRVPWSLPLFLSLILLYLTAGRIPRIDVVVDDDDRSSLSFIVHREMQER